MGEAQTANRRGARTVSVVAGLVTAVGLVVWLTNLGTTTGGFGFLVALVAGLVTVCANIANWWLNG